MRILLAIVSVPTLILAFIIGCGGCGQSPASAPRATAVDPELKPYVTRFYDEAAARGVTSFPLELGNVTLEDEEDPSLDESGSEVFRSAVPRGVEDGHVDGWCSPSPGNDVTIKQSFFRGATEEQREMIMFHELGHCVLGSSHIAGTSGAVIPSKGESFIYIDADRSIMAPVQWGYAYSTYRAQYLDALFQNRAVNFETALSEAYPEVDKKIKERFKALEARIQSIAARASYKNPITTKLARFECNLENDVLHVSPDCLENLDWSERIFCRKLRDRLVSEDVKLKDLCG